LHHLLRVFRGHEADAQDFMVVPGITAATREHCEDKHEPRPDKVIYHAAFIDTERLEAVQTFCFLGRMQ
jgi:hypothetical protein